MKLALLALVLPTLVFSADAFKGKEYLTIGKVEGAYVAPGKSTVLNLNFVVAKGLHVQANPASKPYLIATELKVKDEKGITFGKVKYPTPKKFTLKANKGESEPIDTYEGEFILALPITATSAAKVKSKYFLGKLRYQACTEKTCYFPRFVEVPIVVHVTKDGKKPKS